MASDARGAGTADGRGDGLDRDRLAAWLTGRCLLDRAADLVVERISGGNQNVVARLRGGAAPMILRRPPAAVPEGRNTAMEREFRLLTALEGTTVPHARPLALCTDHEVLGATFYVMAEVDGWSPAASRSWPAPFRPEDGTEARRRLAFELVRGLAAIASADWQARGLDGFGHPEGFHERQVDRWTSYWDRFRFRDIPGLDAAGTWLRANAPAQWTPGIMHGDYSFLNVMFAHGPVPALAAIVDWEMATIGDPLLDLAWLARQWPDRPQDVQTRWVDYSGMPLRDEIVAHYRELTGRPTGNFAYYEVLANFKVAIVLEGGYARYLDGQATSPKVAHYNEAILKAGRTAGELVAGANRRSCCLRGGSHVLSSRRVVTGAGPGAVSRVASDGAARVTGMDSYPGVEIARLWSTDGGEELDSSGIERDPSLDAFYPPPGGTRFVRIIYPPGFGTRDPDADASRFARLLMHRTATVDYGVMLAGELTLVLEDGSESTLRAGDVIVQNGVVHGWRNTASTNAVAVFVLIGYRS